MLKHAALLKRTKNLNRDSAQDTRSVADVMNPYRNSDRIHEMVDQDRSAIWAKRYECLKNLPSGLPCLLHCVQWNNRDEVSEMRSLLTQWPDLYVEHALELLDYAYADYAVRKFAFKCIQKIRYSSDGELCVTSVDSNFFVFTAMINFNFTCCNWCKR